MTAPAVAASTSAPPASPLAFTVPLAAFRDALDRAMTAVKEKGTFPVLACVRITAEASDELAFPGAPAAAPARVTFYATDLDRAVDITLAPDEPAAVVVERGGTVVLNAASLRAALQHAAGDTLRLTVTTGGVAELRVGKARYKMATFPADEMPAFREIAGDDQHTVTAGTLQRVVARLAHATSDAAVPSREMYWGLLFDPTPDGIRVLATTATSIFVRHTLPALPGITEPAIVPVAAAESLARLFNASDVLTIAARDGIVALASATRRLRVRLIEGPWPAFDRVLQPPPADAPGVPAEPSVLRFERAALIEAVRRVRFLAEYERLGIVVAADAGEDLVPAECELQARSADRGAARDTVTCGLTGPVPPPFAVNADVLLAALLKTFTGSEIHVHLWSPKHQIHVIDPEDPQVMVVLGPLAYQAADGAA